MKTHQHIDTRSLELARAVAHKIDADPLRRGVDHARALCARWLKQAPVKDLHAWRSVLEQPWPVIKKVLLDESEYGKRMRQNTPFCGILSSRERWAIYKQAGNHAASST